MLLSELLDQLSVELAGPGVPPARADARDLIAAVLDKPRFWPSANGGLELEPATVEAVRTAAARLREGMPVQYAVGKTAFRHLTLKVDRRVLIPRPETELLVDIVLTLTSGTGVVADVGTGSGAIALALASEGQYDRVIATDVSAAALAVARANLEAIPQEKRGVVEFRLGDLLAPLRGERVRALVSNPPYISPAEAGDLPAGVRDWEPPLALFSGEGGMAAIRAIVRGAPDSLEPGGLLALEVDSTRAELVRETVASDGRYRAVDLRMDLTGRARFVVAKL
jgi:release factor glutamine methyltransferase